MKKIYVFAMAGILVLAFQFTAVTNSFTPPAARTNAPGETTCNASGCHSGTLNAGGGSVSFIGTPANYVPGTKYTLTVQVSDASRSRFGFEATALDGSQSKAGNFSLINTANTSIQNLGSRQYVNHLNASGTSSWTFEWTAPATNVGPVIFYVAGNAANNNGTTSGDNIYTTTHLIMPATSTGVLDAEAAFAVSVYPNPANGKLFISGASLGQTSEIQITDITGKFIRKMQSILSAESLEVNISDLKAGIYFLHFETKDGKQITRKFMVE